MQPIHSSFRKLNDREYRFDVYVSGDFGKLQHIKQVCVLVLSKDRKQVLVVRGRSGWMLPGGGVEDLDNYLNWGKTVDTIKELITKQKD